jgi:hypothetical protein
VVDRHGSDVVGPGMTDHGSEVVGLGMMVRDVNGTRPTVMMLWVGDDRHGSDVVGLAGSDTHSSDVALGMTDTAVMLWHRG